MTNHALIDQMMEKEKGQMSEKQINIIKAAVELFIQKGYASTSTKEIAALAGVSEGSIFKQYATKKGLMLFITHMVMDNIIEALLTRDLDKIMTQSYGDVETFLMTFLKNRVGVIEDGMPILKLVIQELPFQQEVKQILFDNLKKLPLEPLAAKMKQEGLIIDFPDKDIIKIIISSCFGFLAARYVILPEFFADNLEEDIQKFVQVLARGLTPVTKA